MSLAVALESAYGGAALALLPLLVWLYRRKPRFERRAVPSLMFFTEAPDALVRRHRRALDVDLALALGAAAALALAAAGPALGATRAVREVRAVVSGAAPALQRGHAERVEAALARVRAALGPDDHLEVVRVPAGAPQPGERRPSVEALLAAARAGSPARAFLVSDAALVAEAQAPSGVRSLAVGDPAAANLGIVAAAWERGAQAPRVLLTLLNASPRPARAGLVLRAQTPQGWRDVERRPVRLGPDEVQAQLFDVASDADAIEARLAHAIEGEDALAADDRVLLRTAQVRLASALPAPHEAALTRALEAVLGVQGVRTRWDDGEPPDLQAVVLGALAAPGPSIAPGPPTILALAVLAEGEAGVRVPDGPERTTDDALVSDLALAGLDPRRPAGAPAGVRWSLTRGPAPGVGLIGEDAAGRIVVAYDIVRGAPSPAEHPSWPLFVDNLVRRVLGDTSTLPQQAGVRRVGLLDPSSTRLGRDVVPLDPDWLAAAPARQEGRLLRLAPALAALGLLLLLALWTREARRSARAG